MEFSANEKGFSLIELIIVIMITAIVATVAYIKWASGPSFALPSQAELLADDLRYAQNLSMSRGQHYQFVFKSPAINKYQILDSNNNPVTLPSGFLSYTLSSGITFGAINISGATNPPRIVFDGLGKPYSDIAATQPLTSTATIALIAGSQTKVVNVSDETGRISIP